MGNNSPWMQAAAGAASSAIGIGINRLGANYDRKQQMKTQEQLTALQMKAEKEMMDYQQLKELEMWEKTGYGAQVKQMQEAGLNPGLMYGMGGGGGQTTGHGGSPAIAAGTAQHVNTTGMGIQNGMQMALLMSQKKVLDTQAEKNQAEADKTKGVDTANVQADTENKILDKIVKDYTGKELKSQYENVNEPNRTLSQIANADQLAAASDIASIVTELNKEGKLKEKSLFEIEKLALQNAKTREETRNIQKNFEILEENLKGVKFDNMIKELETKLQQETGIDSKSPTWLKILGRLFVQLMQK